MRRERKGRKWTTNVREKGERERVVVFYFFLTDFPKESPNLHFICKTIQPTSQVSPSISLSDDYEEGKKEQKQDWSYFIFKFFFKRICWKA
jgi:hypothetical protein